MQIRLSPVSACLAAGLAIVALIVAAPARSEETAAPLIQAIHALIDHATADPTLEAADTARLRRFYEARSFAPAWVADPTRVAALAAVLAGASEHGLSFPLPKLAGADDAQRDLALTRVALAYAGALAQGRVQPEHFELDWAIAAPNFDAAAGLKTALDHGLVAWYASLPPQHAAYRGLVAVLARYRQIAANGGWVTIGRGDSLKIGMVDERVRALRKRLAAEGDLAMPPPPAPAVAAAANPIQPVAIVEGDVDSDTVFDADLESAVRRFQRRFGIAIDGAVGPRTLAALNVSVRARIEQIELNLERWRALPHDFGASYMMVNVPAEQLDVVNDGTSVITMKVVVGDTEHPTPVVRSTMTAVTLNPTWNIPASIVTKELGPKSKRDPSYLVKNEIVISGRGWQQLPGPKNPLGRIKFESPNKFDVYLHDTPSRIAFDRFFRAQSHGCVRLERANELAGYVLQGTGWNGPQTDAAIATGATQHIDLKRRWRIYLVYATSFVDDDGTVEFRDDLYGRDAHLRAALGGQSPPVTQKQARL